MANMANIEDILANMRANQKAYLSMTYVKSVKPTLASLANPAPAIESTRLPGREIRE
jgi:hypothetical protein